FAKKLLAHRLVIAKALAEGLHTYNATAASMYGPIDAGKRTGANQIQHLIVAVKVTATLPLLQTVELIVGYEFLSKQQTLQCIRGDFVRPNLGSDRLDLPHIEQTDVVHPLDQMFGANRRHDRAAPRRMARGTKLATGFRFRRREFWQFTGGRAAAIYPVFLCYSTATTTAILWRSGLGKARCRGLFRPIYSPAMKRQTTGN